MGIKNELLVLMLCCTLVVLIYSNTFSSSFHFDDYVNIVDNPNIHWNEISVNNIKKIFDREFDRPVSFLTLALNYYFTDLNVEGYHYVNLGIHIVTAFGMFLFLKSIFELSHITEELKRNSLIVAALSSAFWYTSPLQIQAVTYIVQRMAALAAMFYIYGMYFYLKGRVSREQRVLFYGLTVLSALLAVGSKENSYTFPFFILLLEICVIRKGDISFLVKKRSIYLLVISVLAFFVMLWYLYSSDLRLGSWLIYPLKIRLYTGVRVIVFYISQLLLPMPSRLSLEHDFMLSRTLFDPISTFFSFAMIFGIIIYALISLRRHPLFSFFVLWFFGNLALESFSPYLTLVFEHRLYLPSIGFFTIFAIGVNKLFEVRRWRVAILLMVLFIIASFSINTYIRNKVWQDEYSLWNDVIEKSPKLSVGYIGLGTAFAEDEDYGTALSIYQKAQSIDPRNPIVRYDLGVAYFNLKLYEEAINEFRYLGSMGYIGMADKPPITYYFSRIAKNYYGHFKEKAALQLVDEALVLDPNDPELKKLKDKMEKGTITFEEIMQK